MVFLWDMQIKLNMDNKWNEFQITPSKKFGIEVPIFQPSVFREYRGEIFTTFHSVNHPVMNHIADDCEIHGRFSRSYKGVLRGLHWDEKTWKLVSCPHGRIYLVVLDVREKTPDFGKWETFILSPETGIQVLVPPYFANGHFVMDVEDIEDENYEEILRQLGYE